MRSVTSFHIRRSGRPSPTYRVITTVKDCPRSVFGPVPVSRSLFAHSSCTRGVPQYHVSEQDFFPQAREHTLARSFRDH